MLIDTRKAGPDGLIELPGGTQFCLVPLSRGKFPVEVRRNGALGERFSVYEERPLQVAPFSSLVMKTVPHATWLVYVAEEGEEIGGAARQPVELFNFTVASPQQVNITPEDTTILDLLTLTPFEIVTGTWFDLRRFSRVVFGANLQITMETPRCNVKFGMELAPVENPTNGDPTTSVAMGNTTDFYGAVGEIQFSPAVTPVTSAYVERTNLKPMWAAFTMTVTSNGPAADKLKFGSQSRFWAWGFYD